VSKLRPTSDAEIPAGLSIVVGNRLIVTLPVSLGKKIHKMEKQMNLKKQTLIIALAVVATLAAVSSSAFGQLERSIEGVWKTVVTPRNCATGVPAPTVIRGLFTFHNGGTMSEYGIGLGQTPALRSPGHGLWQREKSWQDHTFAFAMLRYDTNGTFIGSQRVSGTLELAESGNEFTTSTTVQILDPNDNPVGGFCATAAGTRFQ